MFKLIKEYFFNLVDSIINEDFPNAAAEMAYMLVIGIFPFMLFLTAVFGWLGKKFFMGKLLAALSAVAPADVIKMITSVLKEVNLFQNGGLIGIAGFLVTLFLASNAIAVIIKGLNRANKIQENRFFHCNGVCKYIFSFYFNKPYYLWQSNTIRRIRIHTPAF